MATWRRLARGSIAAALSTWVALAFHLVGGGELPAIAGVAIPFVLSWCACVALAAWRGHTLRLSASVLLSQGLFHLLFTLGASGRAGGGHHDTVVHLGSADVASAAPWSSMWLAHLAAAVVTILALRSGERAIARLSRALVDGARRLCAAPVLEPPTAGSVRRAVVEHLDVRPALGRFLRDISRRGPPVGVLPR